MTNSDGEGKAAAIIEEILEKTAEEYLQLRIDEPIEKAVASFEFDRDAPVTHQTFTQVTTDFVRHVYERCLWCRQEMSAMEACAEAVAILEEGYQAPRGKGYYAAFLDASNPNLNGLEYVLAQMAGYITSMARTRHIRWVCASRMELADWPTRCLIAEILLKRWDPFLLDNVRTCSPAQFAHHLSELIDLGVSTDRKVSKMLGASIDLWEF
jgi:hypothetical protein